MIAGCDYTLRVKRSPSKFPGKKYHRNPFGEKIRCRKDFNVTIFTFYLPPFPSKNEDSFSGPRISCV